MLVLSRRTSDKICFPNLGISVEVLRIKGNAVRLGIDAPDDVRVLRHELTELSESEMCSTQIERKMGKLSHELRNRLNTATLALHLMQKQIEAGLVGQAETSMQKALDEFQFFEKELGNVNSLRSGQADPQRRALLVEDDTNECELLSGILQMNGFSVDTAHDGLSALSYLDQHELPDVILMDMRMPRLDGPQTVSAIRSTPGYSRVKLFAVSGTDPRDLGVSTGPRGIDRWFSKPLNPSALVVELKRELAAERN